MTNRIFVGCDNAAAAMRDMLADYLASKGLEIIDCGCEGPDDTTEYPVIAKRVCDEISRNGFHDRGILLCGTGIGMCMTANKFRGIRAAVCQDSYSAERSVLSNNANVLCIGARVIGHELAKKIVNEWITLEFRDGSSTPKVHKILDIENVNMK